MPSPTLYLFVSSDDPAIGEEEVGHPADRLLDVQAAAVLPGLQACVVVLGLRSTDHRQHATGGEL